MLLPTVHADYCTGCGMCEQSCVLQESAIKVLPMQLARGEIGAHYRKNLLQRSDAGHVGHTRSGEVVKPTEGLPSFDLPVQRLPDQPVPGDLAPLRSGAEPYNPPPIGGQPGAAP
jgi:ferredoxin-type protein NapG